MKIPSDQQAKREVLSQIALDNNFIMRGMSVAQEPWDSLRKSNLEGDPPSEENHGK